MGFRVGRLAASSTGNLRSDAGLVLETNSESEMENSGVGMLLGDTSVTALWMMFIGGLILGGTILYGVMKTGKLRRSERAQLDRNREMAQRRDDPEGKSRSLAIGVSTSQT